MITAVTKYYTRTGNRIEETKKWATEWEPSS